jgi:superfamily II DNA/RNA helicase
LPYDSNSYVHRAGRTARAGRPGKVVSLMSEFDVPRVEEIEKRIGKQLQLLETKDLCNACF